MTVKPTYEELEKRVRQLEILESGRNQGEDIIQDGEYRWLVENANELILVAQDGLIRFVNQKVFDYLGYSPEELKDRPFVQYIHTEDREIVSERHLKRLKGEDQPGVYPFRVVDRDGKVRWVEINAVLSEWNGKPATLNYINDITERKRMEIELKDERDQLLSLFNSIDEAIYIADLETNELLYVNSYLENLLSKDCIGEKCYKALQGLNAPCSFCTNDIIREQKPEPHRWEYYNPSFDRHYAIVDRVIRWSDGRDVRFEMAIDISAIKKAVSEKEKIQTQLNQAQKMESVGRLAGGGCPRFQQHAGSNSRPYRDGP